MEEDPVEDVPVEAPGEVVVVPLWPSVPVVVLPVPVVLVVVPGWDVLVPVVVLCEPIPELGVADPVV